MVKRFAVALVLLVAAAAGFGWWWARSSVPSLDAEWRLPGLREPIEVVTDAHGVPHVYARDPEDAWFAAGALHARDRLWQMELYRRATTGRLAEALGEPALPVDRRMLTLRMRAAAESEWSRVAPSARAALTRYAEGVNAVTAGLRGRTLPLEFQALGLAPVPWTPQDSLAVARLLSFRLAENQGAELVRYALARAVGPAEADRLTGRYPDSGPTVLGDLAPPAPLVVPPTSVPPDTRPSAETRPSVPSQQADAAGYPPGLAWLDPTAPRANSNAWVVSGQRTATGRPLLANDPHMLLELPAVWYEMHLVAAGLDVQGVTIPGVPYVAIGHNARIAWGFTNTGADVQDFVIERLDLAGRRVQVPGGWEPVRVEDAPIPVRGRPVPSPFEVWHTRSGVVYADEGLDWEAPPVWLAPDASRQGEQHALVLKWSGFDAGGFADAFDGINRAGNWADFQAAADQLSALSQNAVYADVDGNIGYVMTGQLPLRAQGDGGRPAGPGESVWTGVVGGSALPRELNPSAGFLATSNNPVARGGAPFITRDWAAPFRAARLTRTLTDTAKLDVAGAASLQLDLRGDAAAAVLASIDSAIAAAGGPRGDPSALRVLEQLKGWDRIIDGDEDVALYQTFEDRLWRRTFTDDFPEALFRRFYEWAGAERFAGIYPILDEPNARWWDDIATVERRETRDDMFVLAAADAARDVASRAAGARAWGQVHAATFAHSLGDGGRVFAWLFNRGPIPVAGDGTTLMRMSYRRLRGFAAWEHPSWRQVLDVGAWDNSRVVLPAGQSGHPLSSNYFDQNALWRNGEYRRLAFSRVAVDAAAARRQIATP